MTFLRTFAIAAAIGAALSLAALGAAPLVRNPRVAPLAEPAAAGATTERWYTGSSDRIASTAAADLASPRFPTGIAALEARRLAGTSAATMKIHDAQGTVIAVASRFNAPEREGRSATWWTFVVGARGTLVAYVADADTGAGSLLGGTRDFEAARGEFVEQRTADGGYALRITRRVASAKP